MILNMQQDETRKWIAVVVASSYGVSSDQFNQMVEADGWDNKAIDFRVTMNGVEFTELDELFDRIHEHVEKQRLRIEALELELNLK